MKPLLTKEFGFEAAHQTPGATLHGHSFQVEVALTGSRHPVFGWTHDLNEVEPIFAAVRSELDHRYLNDIEGLAIPTIENVARWIWERLQPQLTGLQHVAVRRGTPGHSEGCRYSGLQD